MAICLLALERGGREADGVGPCDDERAEADGGTRQALRRALTPPEARLWMSLRLRPAGLKFRRQHPLGPFILDFDCEAARLAVEVDGGVHGFGDGPWHDARRDAWLGGRGVLVIRIIAEEVRTNLDGVLDGIVDEAVRRL